MNAFVYDGIEFILPGIFKASTRVWANELVSNGTIYFTNRNEFIKDEHLERGDPLDCVGVTKRNDIRCTSDPTNPIFIWCSTMENDPLRILSTWQDRDTVIQISNTMEFARRIQKAIKNEPHIIGLQVGPVTYDKDQGSHRDYHWAESIFQKGLRFNNQKEFRFALVGESYIQQKENVVLNIGPCSDIVRIEYLHSSN